VSTKFGYAAVVTRWLNPHEQRAWRGYRRMRALLDLRLARDLMRDSGLSEADYDVLSTLGETDGHRMRLTELAAHMLWSKSRLSHHIGRMAQRGLVTREPCDDDGRGSVVALTASGREAIEAAAPRHVESVRRNFVDLIEPAELAALDALTERVVARLLKSRDPSAGGA
jgi:DNA-binding MarR family transcriptional regulator